MKATPTEFECMDNGDPVFKVSMFDAHSAEVKISSLVNHETWPEISAEIQKCLDSMEFEL